MSRVEAAFRSLPAGEQALVAYATAGFPDRDTSLRIASALLEHCDLLELGIPFSDPVMDGPIIQASSQAALRSGTRVEGVLDMVAELRRGTDKPLLIMSYYNPVLRFGLSAFAERAAEAGADGVLLPDLPLEEMGEWKEAAGENGLCTVLFASMTTPPERLRLLGEATEGFLYCLAVKGTTGLRDSLASGLSPFVSRVREHCSLPLALGLGISNPEQCREAGELADGVVVGSALVKAAMDALQEGRDPASGVGRLAKTLKEALRP